MWAFGPRARSDGWELGRVGDEGGEGGSLGTLSARFPRKRARARARARSRIFRGRRHYRLALGSQEWALAIPHRTPRFSEFSPLAAEG